MKVLLVTTESNWWGIARLPEHLKDEGFNIDALCPAGALLTKTKFVDQAYTFQSPLSPFLLFYLINAFNKSDADIIIPGDDYAAICLQNFVSANSFMSRLISQKLHNVLVKSTGDKKWFSAINNKKILQQYAQQLNIRTPSNSAVTNLAKALEKATEISYPVVLKLDQGFGGQEVRICQNDSDVEKCFDNLDQERKISKVKKIKEIIKEFLLVKYLHEDAGISIQKYIKGKPAYFTFFSRKGFFSGGVTAVAIKTYPGEIGPSSVVGIIKNEEVEKTAKQIVELTGHTGFGGLDFIIDENDHAYLLEFNPRVTALSYFVKELGVNLSEALKHHINDEAYQTHTVLPVKHELIALYPKEIQRDPHSKYLDEAFHDVPLNDPGLLVHI